MDFGIKKDLTSNWFKTLQEAICYDIANLEGNKIQFTSNTWQRSKIKDEGGGEYRILKNGKIFEKVGVNFSKVYGKFPKEFQKNIPGAAKDPRFWASGISVVMHMKNPHIPAMHFNTRYISTTYEWFGGGMDVTPCIEDKNEKKNFHLTLKKMCDRHNKNYYKKENFEKDFKFVRDVGVTFQMLFNSIIEKKIKKKWTNKDKEIQYIKRGRYAEFNLLYDRGTKFGLQTGGNVEAILMSLPPLAKWK